MPPIFSHLFIQYGLYGCKLQEIPVASLDLQTILDRVKNDDIRHPHGICWHDVSADAT